MKLVIPWRTRSLFSFYAGSVSDEKAIDTWSHLFLLILELMLSARTKRELLSRACLEVVLLVLNRMGKSSQ